MPHIPPYPRPSISDEELRRLQLRLIEKEDKLSVADETIQVLERLLEKHLRTSREKDELIAQLKTEIILLKRN